MWRKQLEMFSGPEAASEELGTPTFSIYFLVGCVLPDLCADQGEDRDVGATKMPQIQ